MELRLVPVEEKEKFREIFQTYQHELSQHSGSRRNSAGLYPYIYFDLYWDKNEPRFPFYVIENDQVAGLLLLRHLVKDELNRPVCGLQIAEIYITPQFRGAGLAARVVQETARRGQLENRRVTWSCYQSNVRALGLYDKVLKIFRQTEGWQTERKPFVDVTGRPRIFFSLIPSSASQSSG